MGLSAVLQWLAFDGTLFSSAKTPQAFYNFLDFLQNHISYEPQANVPATPGIS